MKWYEYMQRVSRFFHCSPYSDWSAKGSYSGPHSPYIHTISSLLSLCLYSEDGGGISSGTSQNMYQANTAVRTSNLRGIYFEE
jgi:hypothetical protein